MAIGYNYAIRRFLAKRLNYEAIFPRIREKIVERLFCMENPLDELHKFKEGL